MDNKNTEREELVDGEDDNRSHFSLPDSFSDGSVSEISETDLKRTGPPILLITWVCSCSQCPQTVIIDYTDEDDDDDTDGE